MTKSFRSHMATTETVLETSAANATSTSPIKKSITTSTPPRISNTYARIINDKDSNECNDEVVPIPFGMFDTEPIFETVLETLATNVASASPIKVKPTTKPTPTLVSNTYEFFANDNNNDDDVERADHTVEIKQVPRTGKTVQRMNNKKMTSLGRDERDNRGDDNTDTRLVVVETCELRNTRIKKKTAVNNSSSGFRYYDHNQ